VTAKSTRTTIIEALWPAGTPARMGVWVILDGARDQRIYGAVHGSYAEKCCLYSGTLPWQLQMAAPHLVRLEKDDRFTDYVLDHGWGHSWGIYLRTETDIKVLRRHLRGFLRVRDRAGRRLIFRYYDPRVMRVYLPTCTKEELRTVYGPITNYICEGEDGASILDFAFDGLTLAEKQCSLEAVAR